MSRKTLATLQCWAAIVFTMGFFAFFRFLDPQHESPPMSRPLWVDVELLAFLQGVLIGGAILQRILWKERE